MFTGSHDSRESPRITRFETDTPSLVLYPRGKEPLAALAIGAGAMTVSHANDSYFWIITEFSDMETATAY